MTSPYRRRKPSLIRNLWVYRRLVAAAIVLGLLLWFIVINHAPVTVYFPFGLGKVTSSTGVMILLGAICGSVATGLILTLFVAVRRLKSGPAGPADDAGGGDIPEDRPPTDYAAKTTDGFPGTPWGDGLN